MHKNNLKCTKIMTQCKNNVMYTKIIVLYRIPIYSSKKDKYLITLYFRPPGIKVLEFALLALKTTSCKFPRLKVYCLTKPNNFYHPN